MRDDMDVPEEVVWEGRFIAAKRRGKWEYVSRTRNISAAVILAVHEGEVILVEQYRVPIRSQCLELPAGLVGHGMRGLDDLDATRVGLVCRRHVVVAGHDDA